MSWLWFSQRSRVVVLVRVVVENVLLVAVVIVVCVLLGGGVIEEVLVQVVAAVELEVFITVLVIMGPERAIDQSRQSGARGGLLLGGKY